MSSRGFKLTYAIMRLMQQTHRAIHLEIPIARPPEAVRRWWTKYPDEYVATDPKEQPFRIHTLGWKEGRRHVLTTWRRPTGKIVEWEEVLHVAADGSWTYDIARTAEGYRVFDHFTPAPDGKGGTLLRIESTVEALTDEATSGIDTQVQRMEAGWRSIVPLCERDAPS